MPAAALSPIPPSSAQEETVHAALAGILRRVRLLLWFRWTARALWIASPIALAFIAVHRTHILAMPLWPLLLAGFALALAVPAYLAARFPISQLAVARLADDRQGLKARLSSALALGKEPSLGSSFVRLQTEDAAEAASRISSRAVAPLRITWEEVLAVLLLILVIGASFGGRDAKPSSASSPGASLVAQQGAQLAGEARRIARQADGQDLAQTSRYARQAERLAGQMQTQPMSSAQALKSLSDLSNALRRQQGELARQSQGTPNNTQAKTAASPRAGQPSAAEPSASQNAKLSSALLQAAHNLEAARTAREQRQAAQDLRKLAQAAQGGHLDQARRSIESASRALDKGNRAQAASDLKSAFRAAQQQQGQSQSAAGAQRQPGSSQKSAQTGGTQSTAGAQPHPGSSQTGMPTGGTRDTGGTQPQTGSPQTGSAGESGQTSHSGNTGQAKPGESQGNQTGAGSQDAAGLQRIGQALQSAASRLGGGPSGQGHPANGPLGQPSAGPGGFNPQPSPGEAQTSNGGPSNITHGNGKGSPTAPGKYAPARISGKGYQTPQENTGVWRGAPRQLDRYNPQESRRYARIYLPTSSSTGRAVSQNVPGSAAAGQTSSVPYGRTAQPFRKSHETAIDREDIPPAYANKVRRYFESLTPPPGH